MPYGVRAERVPVLDHGAATWSVDWRFVMLALSSGLVGSWLVAHYPIFPWAVSTAFGAACIAFWRWPRACLIMVPALLPMIGFAPWTGWITFEELDILVLSAATGGYGRLAISRPPDGDAKAFPSARIRGIGLLTGLMVALFVISVMLSMARGFADAGGFDFGWYRGYNDASNSLRLAKPILLALLLWPLYGAALREAPQVNGARFSIGLVIGLMGAALAVVWERHAFTGLLDFSSDYRTTALFWEMHVGGAALDGFLALTVPFAVREVVTAKTPWRWAAGAVAVLLAGYACLTTFSRIVYFAIPSGLVALLWLQFAQKRRLAMRAPQARHNHGLLLVLVMAGGFWLSAAWMFPTSGYRGLLALFGAMAVLLPLAGVLRRSTPSHIVLGLALGVGLSSLATGVAAWLPKGAYFAYAVSAVAAVGLVMWPRLRAERNTGVAATLALASFVSMLAGVCLVAQRWRGDAGMHSALPVVTVLLAIALLSSRSKRALWPDHLRWHGIALSAMFIVATVVAVFGGGAYMIQRFATSSQDLDDRLRHWRDGFAALRTPEEWLLGKGLGRFPASQLLVGAEQPRPGDYRLAGQEGNPYLVLAGGRQESGWGDLFRVSQRVPVPVGTVTVRFDVRAETKTSLHFEVCEKHLLYDINCQYTNLEVAARPGEWQSLSAALKGRSLSSGAWYAPRFIAFSVGITSAAARIDLDNLMLTDAQGSELLANGDFSQGLARWFFTSDRSHLPWHVKNLLLNLLFEQGVVGGLLFTMLVAGSLWRLMAGNARDHPLAPAAAAALIGFLVIGMVDSLVDVPRIAFLFYLLLLLGLTLRVPRSQRSR